MKLIRGCLIALNAYLIGVAIVLIAIHTGALDGIARDLAVQVLRGTIQ